MNRRITILLDLLYTDIMFSGETQENKEKSFETIENLREELRRNKIIA